MMSKASTNVYQEDREMCTKVTGRVVLNEVEDYLRWNNMIQKNAQFFATVVESVSLVLASFSHQKVVKRLQIGGDEKRVTVMAVLLRHLK